MKHRRCIRPFEIDYGPLTDCSAQGFVELLLELQALLAGLRRKATYRLSLPGLRWAALTA